MLNQHAVPHIPNAVCEVFEAPMRCEIVLHLRTLEHHLYLILDRFRIEPMGWDSVHHFAELFHQMSRATNSLPSGTYETRNPNDFVL